MSRFTVKMHPCLCSVSIWLLISARSGMAAEIDLPTDLLTLCLATLPETKPEQLWTSWSLSPVVVLPLILVAFVYLRGLSAIDSNARPTVVQRAFFTAGVGCLAVALVSPLCRMASTLAWAHMVQHVLLVVGVPLLLVLSRPGRALLAGVPANLRIKLERWRHASVAVQPHVYLLVSFVLYGLNIWIWHIPALYQGALLNVGLHVLMYAMLLVVSLVFWHSIIDTYRAPSAASGLATMLLFFTFLHTALLGLLLALSPRIWYPLMALRGASWGLPPLDDQRLAGLIMWIPMGGIYFVAALAIMARLIAGSGQASSKDTAPARIL
ncbi:cytochrome c oxidase assembly protein [Microvirga sp. VF16]|uniref:cytochrome c oxidase assembly protein n=1 Tax=Microvirga sp. VF16 TaxID=2807101 RepID=UPI00193DFD29|nr:cytochrome c oxidase assembly protein [Microvirga sp. VF16]QRM35272.1 cytochrome c oxidase assembly protein [Microvirga sp. VF16]